MTLAGTLEAPEGQALESARAAYEAASPASELYGGFGDFTFYVLRVERVRWVGGYGRMDSTDADAFHAAEPDPVASGAASAIEHLNTDHADALLLMAQKLGGHPDASEARACGSTATAWTSRSRRRVAPPRRDSASRSRPTGRATCGPPRSSSPNVPRG